MNDNRLGVCLLSCVRHQRNYAPLFAAHPDLQIVCVADEPDVPAWIRDVNQAFSAQYRVPYLPLDQALARADVDIVSICSEPTRHARLARAAAQAGVHVLVDKPMATNSAEADELRRAVASSEVKLTFIHHLFNYQVGRARQLIDSGRLATPWAFHMDIIAGGGLDPTAVEDFAMVVDPDLSGGGELMNWLNYAIGTLRWLIGLEIESVYALANTFFFEPHRQFGVEDFGVIALHFDHGVTATVTAGRIPARIDAVPGSFTIRGQGIYGQFMLDQFRPRITVEKAAGELTAGVQPFSLHNGLDRLIDDFVHAIRTDARPRATVDDGVAIVRVMEAVYQSVETGAVTSV